LIRFVIDPMTERRLKNALEYKDSIVKLVAGARGSRIQFERVSGAAQSWPRP
jgi:hypothetical protein